MSLIYSYIPYTGTFVCKLILEREDKSDFFHYLQSDRYKRSRNGRPSKSIDQHNTPPKLSIFHPYEEGIHQSIYAALLRHATGRGREWLNRATKYRSHKISFTTHTAWLLRCTPGYN